MPSHPHPLLRGDCLGTRVTAIVVAIGALLAASAVPALAADQAVRATPLNTFEPPTVTVLEGDSVSWTNDGGNHNVKFDDGQFEQPPEPAPPSGWPASPPRRTFTEPGEYRYYCELHGAPGGLGMAGRVVVGQVVSIEDTRVVEGSSGTVNATFTVTRANPSGTTRVDYATSNGTALAPDDYTQTSGTLTFTGSSATQTIAVPVNGDTVDEPAETFTLTLSRIDNGKLGDSTATGTILDDDDPPPPPPAEPGPAPAAGAAAAPLPTPASRPYSPGRRPGKCSRLKGRKRAACLKRSCGKLKGRRRKACIKKVTRRR